MSSISELNRSPGPSDPPGDWVPSPFPPWTPPEPESPQLSRTAAEELGRNIQSVATAQATMDARLLELIGEFDAGAAIRHFDAIESTAHWLGWACSMAPGTAREHVRVARADTPAPDGGWQFRMPNHTPVHPPAVWQSPDGAYRHLLRPLQQWFDSNQHQPPTVCPPHAGAGFSLHECVRVLFDITRPNEPHEPQDEPMAA